MTDQPETTEELTSQAIRDGIAKAQHELDTLTPVITDLQAEQRKLAALATVGLLTGAKVDRQREVVEELATLQARKTDLAAGIEGAQEFLHRALETERIAKAKADWAEAEALLAEALVVADEAEVATEQAGARFAKLEGLLEEAAALARPHLQPVSSRSLLDAEYLKLTDAVGLILKTAGGPAFDFDMPYGYRPGDVPSLKSKIADYARRFAEQRDRQDWNERQGG